MKEFADRLREARVAAGLTQEQLGFALGVTKSSVSAWENSRETPSFRLLPQLRSTLKRSLDELICAATSAVTKIRDSQGDHMLGNADNVAHDAAERTLLRRYRGLSVKRQSALLELIRS